jgi:flagellar protein FlbB
MSVKMLGIYGGFFVGMLALALFVTGVFQQGILPRFSRAAKSETAKGQEPEGAAKAPGSATEVRKTTEAATAPTSAAEPAKAVQGAGQAILSAPTETLSRAATDRSAQVTRLARMYEGMRPKEAAGVLEKLERPLAAQVLAAIKERQAAKILGVMNPDVAAELTRLLGAGVEKATS